MCACPVRPLQRTPLLRRNSCATILPGQLPSASGLGPCSSGVPLLLLLGSCLPRLTALAPAVAFGAAGSAGSSSAATSASASASLEVGSLPLAAVRPRVAEPAASARSAPPLCLLSALLVLVLSARSTIVGCDERECTSSTAGGGVSVSSSVASLASSAVGHRADGREEGRVVCTGTYDGNGAVLCQPLRSAVIIASVTRSRSDSVGAVGGPYLAAGDAAAAAARSRSSTTAFTRAAYGLSSHSPRSMRSLGSVNRSRRGCVHLCS